MNPSGTASLAYILMFSTSWFLGSALFTFFWKKRFKNGPMELLMRRLAG
jgi:uncharacterized protein